VTKTHTAAAHGQGQKAEGTHNKELILGHFGPPFLSLFLYSIKKVVKSQVSYILGLIL